MSDNIYDAPGLIVTRYVGPAHEQADRQRWQFTPVGDSVAVLKREDVRRLCAVLLADTKERDA